jgi:hypothetical protein
MPAAEAALDLADELFAAIERGDERRLDKLSPRTSRCGGPVRSATTTKSAR